MSGLFWAQWLVLLLNRVFCVWCFLTHQAKSPLTCCALFKYPFLSLPDMRPCWGVPSAKWLATVISLARYNVCESVLVDIFVWVSICWNGLLPQKQAWPVHKSECKCLQSVLPRIPTDSVRLAARIIFALVSLSDHSVFLWQRKQEKHKCMFLYSTLENREDPIYGSLKGPKH